MIGVSLLTGTMTNFMSDGATVAALGPIVLPMATLANVSVWKVGLDHLPSPLPLANFLVVGTPNNAICFGMGKDPETGERLLDVMDFVKSVCRSPFWPGSYSGAGRFSDIGGSLPGKGLIKSTGR